MRKLARLSGTLSGLKVFGGKEAGLLLMEALVSLAILGIAAAVILSGLATGAKANFIADRQATAESLALSQMEYVKTAGYAYEATGYTAAPLPSGEDYAGYSVSIYAQPLNNPDNGIQKITVTVKHSGKDVISLEGYKVN